MKAFLIDCDYVTRDARAVIRMIMKRSRFFRIYDSKFEPYFYAVPRAGSLDALKLAVSRISLLVNAERIQPERIETEEKLLFGKKAILLKIFCKHPSHVRVLREHVRGLADVYEADIVFPRRYLIDRGLSPFDSLEFTRKGKELKEITRRGEPEGLTLRTLAFDIETYNPIGAPRPDKDPVIMISYADDESGVITCKPIPLPFVRRVADEKAMIEEFCKRVKEKDVELLLGYNDVEFDLPYLRDRAKKSGAELRLGRDASSSFKVQQRGLFKHAKIAGRIHLDLYAVAKFLALIGAVKTRRLTLGEIYNEMFGEEKKKVKKLDIWRMWDGSEEDLKTLAEYSLHDAVATKRIADKVIPLEFALARLVGASLPDVCGATTGQMVEMLLWREAHAQNRIVPNKPDKDEVRQRESMPVQGAYVKLPEAGIYENLAVFDFRGMYPSIIISHNIDMDSLNCACCADSEKHVSPLGHKFCSKKKGLVPSVLERLIDERDRLKKELKSLKPGTQEYEAVFAKSQAFKIISNSFYGFLLYARSRWYSRPCGESVTAYGRHYIQETIRKAEEAGFKVLYSDTDSVVMQLGNKPKEDALAFMKKINSELPGRMELELEGFYPRGVFVGKKLAGAKAAEVGAKKKYALIGEDGRIKIRGFELVRRDWSRVARHTQQKVLEAILKEGSKEKAVEIIREVISDLRTGKTKIEDCVIYSSIRKDLRHYAVTSPEVSAAQKAIKAGIPVQVGSLVGYVITKKGKTVSEKAEIAELAKDYDASYYIDHQVLPAVLKIMKELGYSEDDLKGEGKQSTLGGW